MRAPNRKHVFLLSALICALTAVTASPAAAYVGPGAGLSLLGALWGLAIAVAAAVGFILLWPFRRLLRKRSTRRAPSPQLETRKTKPSTSPGGDDEVSRHGAA